MWRKLLIMLVLTGCSYEDYLDKLNDSICKYPCPIPNDSNDYVLLGADDDLDPYDLTVFDTGLPCLGYNRKLIDLNLTRDLFNEYVEDTSYFLYFSGHGGSDPYISITDDIINFEYQPFIFNATYVFISACSVLKNADIVKSRMGVNTRVLMGYTKPAKDDIDSWVAYEMLVNMYEGIDIATAFFNVHRYHPSLHDRWVMFVRQLDGTIVEYSERSGNRVYS